MTIIALEAADGPIEELFVVPTAGEGPWPGVVILYDIFGLTPDVRNISQRVADAGYVVITPNLYSRGGPATVR